MISWDNRLYEFANDCMVQSWDKWDLREIGSSWGYTMSARLAYVSDAIINLVILPFAIIGVTFGTLHALFTWNRQSPIFQSNLSFITQKTNHLLLSCFGAFISPALAHRFRDANLVPYVIALRIAVLTGALILYFKKP